MRATLTASLAVLLIWGALCAPAGAQSQSDVSERQAAERAAMAALAFMDGAWRGTAWTLLPGGGKRTLAQTERVGPFLDGAVKLIEGRGYEADGRLEFNAFATIAFDPDKRAYTMRSYAHGRFGDFAFVPSAEGFVWEILAGPVTIRYTATIRSGRWREIGERLAPGREPMQFFEMNLQRIGDTDWPAAGAIGPR